MLQKELQETVFVEVARVEGNLLAALEAHRKDVEANYFEVFKSRQRIKTEMQNYTSRVDEQLKRVSSELLFMDFKQQESIDRTQNAQGQSSVKAAGKERPQRASSAEKLGEYSLPERKVKLPNVPLKQNSQL